MRHHHLALVALAALSLPLSAAEQSAPARLVFVAGPKDHGGPGAHEHRKDLDGLKACLASSNVKNVAVDIYEGKVPDVSALKSARVLVMESSGDRTPTEHHVLFPQDATTDHQAYDAPNSERLKQIDALAKKGMGVVIFHYATYVNNSTGRKYMLDWVGGYYESGSSRTVVSNWGVAPTGAKHPILSGVEPWTNREEFYINYQMPAKDARRTPLLIATPTAPTRMPPPPPAMVPPATPPPTDEPPNVEPSLVGWAVQRDGGGRGFVMTGVDWHSNLQIDAYRRALLNGIVWAAGMEVPPGGVQCKLPEAAVK